MRTPMPYDLFGDRGVEFNDTFPIVGADLTGASFSGQVRLYPDSPSPLFSLSVTLVYGGTDTVANHISAGRISPLIKTYPNPNTNEAYADADSIALSVLRAHAASSLMVSPTLPGAAEAGDTVKLAWDLLITPLGGVADKWVAGAFWGRGTVTQ